MSALGKLYAKHVCNGSRLYPDDIPQAFRDEVKIICLNVCPDKIPVESETAE